MDSAITPSLQLSRAKGEEASRVPIWMTQLERVSTFSLRRKIALHTIEAGGYSIAR